MDAPQKQWGTIKENHLEKGKIETILVPDLGYGDEYSITKWRVQPGQLVRTGDVVCELENGPVTLEFESYYSGRLLSTCSMKQNLKVDDEIFRIQGVKEKIFAPEVSVFIKNKEVGDTHHQIK